MEFFHIYYEKSQIRRTGAALVQFLAEGRFFYPSPISQDDVNFL